MTKSWEDCKVEQRSVKPTLYLIRGLPGSGKSTFALQLLNANVVKFVLEADQWFVQNNNGVFDASKLGQAHLCCKEWTRTCLVSNTSVAVSNTSTTEKEVETYRKLAEDYGANFVSLIVENRNNTTNVHNVPEETIEKMRNRFTLKL